MRIAGLLRLTALGLALLCVLDPPVVVMPQVPIAADIVEVRSARDADPAAAHSVALALAAALDDDAGVRLETMAEGAAVPCDAFRPCVVVGAPSARVHMPLDREGRTYVIGLEPGSAALTIDGVSASATHPSAEGHAVVTLTSRGLSGEETHVALLDGGAVVGEATYRWGDDTRAEVSVPWWPIAAGRRILTARVGLAGAETAAGGHEWTTPVEVGSEPWSVIVHERRPSWATTFARRALALDPRFALTARTDLAPRVAATPGASPSLALGDGPLDTARVVMVGAPETLTADDVSRLERFARERGGSIVLVPDQAFSGPVTRLLTERWRERIRPEASATAGLTAREWLVADGAGPFDEVIGTQAGDPAILATPMGAGRLVVVGALDAWRTRARDEGFDRFWQQTVARLAAVTPPPVAVVSEPAVAMPGDEVRVRVQVRSVRTPSRLVASASLRCGDDDPVEIRLWPAGGTGAFAGHTGVPATEGTCDLRGVVQGVGEGRAAVSVSSSDIPEGRTTLEEVGRAAIAGGGLSVGAAEVAQVAASLAAGRSAERVPERRYPMRSSWWLLLLLACVGGEWWLRRRGGLR